MNACKCGSHAINQHLHGRQEGVDLHLCDVCYWRTRAERLRAAIEEHKKSFLAEFRDPEDAGNYDRGLWSELDR